jgi:hypothetical protein
VTFYPVGGGYELGAAPTVAKLLAAVPALRKALVAVRGFAKGWCVKFEGIAA